MVIGDEEQPTGLTDTSAAASEAGRHGREVAVRVLILTFGTHGDVLPYVALASGLLASGHEAAVCTAKGFRELVIEAGVP